MPQPLPACPPSFPPVMMTDPTFGCVVYVGHAAVLQLHRLSILKGKRFCNKSNTGLCVELGVREGSLTGDGLASPHEAEVSRCPYLSAPSLGECMRWFHPQAGSLALQAASLLWRWKWGEVGQAQKSGGLLRHRVHVCVPKHRQDSPSSLAPCPPRPGPQRYRG